MLEYLLAPQARWSPPRSCSSAVWDEATDPFTTTVKTTIGRLRAKLGEPPLIETVREAGYRIGGARCDELVCVAAPAAAHRAHAARAVLRRRSSSATGALLCFLTDAFYVTGSTSVARVGKRRPRRPGRRPAAQQ